MNNSWWTFLATCGFVGYLPMSGTLASMAMLPFLIMMRHCYHGPGIFLLLVCFTVSAYFIIQQALFSFKEKDPSAIVLDEMIGMLWAFYGLPITEWRLIVGFILFRFFDITKLPFLYYVERLPGALGIMLDDIGAAIMTAFLVWIITT